jgi:hypothetical protein
VNQATGLIDSYDCDCSGDEICANDSQPHTERAGHELRCDATLLTFLEFLLMARLYAKSAHFVLQGIDLETDHPFSGLSFSKDHLQEFNVAGQLRALTIKRDF